MRDCRTNRISAGPVGAGGDMERHPGRPSAAGAGQEGLYLSPHAVLAHTRLCVIGPAGGAQPMTGRRRGAGLYTGL